jgi:hypothetical protein
MQVWKFPLRLGAGSQQVRMPGGAQLLSVQLQGGEPMLWALCDERAPSVSRQLWAYGTGEAMVRAWPFVATLQIGSAVLHYFDLGERRID